MTKEMATIPVFKNSDGDGHHRDGVISGRGYIFRRQAQRRLLWWIVGLKVCTLGKMDRLLGTDCQIILRGQELGNGSQAERRA